MRPCKRSFHFTKACMGSKCKFANFFPIKISIPLIWKRKKKGKKKKVERIYMRGMYMRGMCNV